MRSAPTITAAMPSLRNTVAAALSTMSVVGMPSCVSSHAVRRAPCRSGRVSVATTPASTPCSHAARTTPSAVPYPAVARAPVLQCVSTRAPCGSNAAPYAPMAMFAWRSSASIACASRRVRSTASAGSEAASAARRVRATAQGRFTAVGRAAASCAAASASSSRKAGTAESHSALAASTTPYAPATPMAGAPRTCIDWMAVITSCQRSSSTYSTRVGSRRWSSTRSRVPVHSSDLT